MPRTDSNSTAKPQVYATSADFARVFREDMGSLHSLSLLLTADHQKAEECFVSGLDDCVVGNDVFREWARSWARRAIIQNAIRMLAPRQQDPAGAPAQVGSGDSEFAQTPEANAAITNILKLRDFERFVFVLSVLERYTDQECSVLLGCSRQDVREAKTRGLQQLSESATTSITAESPAAKQVHQRSGTVVTLVFAIIHVLGCAAGCAAALLSPGPAMAQAQLGFSTRSEAVPVPVIGFVGGFIRDDDFQHSEVKIARTLKTTYRDGVAQNSGQETAVRSAASSESPNLISFSR
jgi:DNA-directed RNA polymerase specialized sigma24 family protein